jgi:signal recognition particle subunit SRP68
MDALERRAGRTPSAPTPAAAAAAVRAAAPAQEKKVAAEEERAETPEPAPTKQSGGLGSLLGGWWGRK